MSISRQVLFGKLNPYLFKSLESATILCKMRGNPYVELPHWLHCILQNLSGDFTQIFAHFSVNIDKAMGEMARTLDSLPAGASSITDFSYHLQILVEKSWNVASLIYGGERIRSAHLLVAMLQTPEVKQQVLGMSAEFKKIDLKVLEEQLARILEGSSEQDDGLSTPEAIPGEGANAMPQSGGKKSPLDTYCVNLTQLARQNKIDPIIGRQQEITTMIDILLRRRQNNPLIVGEAGVGKTAVVEALALAIHHKETPPSLHTTELLSLDVGGLLAGASMKGEFEARLKSVIEAASTAERPVILFIDEIHTLIGAGGAAGTGDAANLLKPILARGGLRVIGATTWSEYKKHVEKDPALTRRFQTLQVLEPTDELAIKMVMGVALEFEKHHQVLVLESAIQAAVKLSSRYLPSRQLPDKAVSLLDTACARVALSQHAIPTQLAMLRQKIGGLEVEIDLLEKQSKIGLSSNSLNEVIQERDTLKAEALQLEGLWAEEKALVEQIVAARQQLMAAPDQAPADLDALRELEAALSKIQGEHPMVLSCVDEGVVAEVLATWTGIPVGKMLKNEIQQTLTLDTSLGQRVIGQEDALSIIAERVQASKAKLTDPNKPIGVFLLVGPSGVGKTETALALADIMYGGEQNIISINMSEYQEAHTVSSLKGSPPGYVGYGEGGVLTEAVRRKPYSVVLLDEVEKAHPDVHEMFFQVFDKGWMEDGEGRYIDFKNTLILLTSNVGSDIISDLHADEEIKPTLPALAESIDDALRKVFPAAFVGRLSIVPYRPLSATGLRQIVDHHFNKIKARMKMHYDVELDFAPNVFDLMMTRCVTSDTGARNIIHYIEQHILPKLSRYWLGKLDEGSTCSKVMVEVNDAGIINCHEA